MRYIFHCQSRMSASLRVWSAEACSAGALSRADQHDDLAEGCLSGEDAGNGMRIHHCSLPMHHQSSVWMCLHVSYSAHKHAAMCSSQIPPWANYCQATQCRWDCTRAPTIAFRATCSGADESCAAWIHVLCGSKSPGLVHLHNHRFLIIGGLACLQLGEAVPGRQASAPSMLIGIPQPADDSGFECGICLGATADTGFNNCKHSLCADCAIWCAHLESPADGVLAHFMSLSQSSAESLV